MNTTLLFKLTFVILLLVVYFGCDSNNQPSSGDPIDTTAKPIIHDVDRFMPLTIGNYWAYSVSWYVYDTTQICYVKDTVSLKGNTYYLVDIYSKLSTGERRVDTLYIRFARKDVLHWFQGGKDSLYIDFTTLCPYGKLPFYPGYLQQYPVRDSFFMGDFDSCTSIIYPAFEPQYSIFAPQVGELIRPFIYAISPQMRFIGGRVDNKIITYK